MGWKINCELPGQRLPGRHGNCVAELTHYVFVIELLAGIFTGFNFAVQTIFKQRNVDICALRRIVGNLERNAHNIRPGTLFQAQFQSRALTVDGLQFFRQPSRQPRITNIAAVEHKLRRVDERSVVALRNRSLPL